jgi:hypothetical protein
MMQKFVPYVNITVYFKGSIFMLVILLNSWQSFPFFFGLLQFCFTVYNSQFISLIVLLFLYLFPRPIIMAPQSAYYDL